MNITHKKGYHSNKRLNREFLELHTQLKEFFKYDVEVADVLRMEFRHYSLYKLGYAEVDKNVIEKMNKLLELNLMSVIGLVDVINFPFKKTIHKQNRIDHSGSVLNKQISDMIKEIREIDKKKYTYQKLNEILGMKPRKLYTIVNGDSPAKKEDLVSVKELYNKIKNTKNDEVVVKKEIVTVKDIIKVNVEMPVDFKGSIKITSE